MMVAARIATNTCGGVEVHRAGLHQIAEPAVRRDQLGDHRAADRIGHGDAEAGEDRRHRAGKHDVAADLPLAGADHLRHLHELGLERAHARQRAEIDDEEHHRRDQRDLGFDADAEPQDEQRREGELGRAVAADHERIEDRHHDRLPAQQERQQHRRHAADHAADQRFVDRVAAVEDQLAVEQRRDKARRHRPRRAQPVVAEPQAAGLPGREQDQQHDQPVEPDAPTHDPTLVRSSRRIGRTGTNRSSTRGALAMTPCSSR